MPHPAFDSPESSRNAGTQPQWMPPKIDTFDRIKKVARDRDKALQVVIVDRDSMGSDLLADALARDRLCEAIALRPPELLDRLATSDVDLVVIGVDLDSKPGKELDLTNSVHRAHPNVHIVMLLSETSRDIVISAFRAGARGVFSRQLPMAEFIDCIEHVGKGFIWAGRDETNVLLEAFKNIPSPNLPFSNDSPVLTARELQVARCAARGLTNKSIASELFLSEHTVKNYLFRSFEKLGVSSRVELLFSLTTRGHSFSDAKSDDVVIAS